MFCFVLFCFRFIGEQLLQYVKDQITGADLDYGFDLRRKIAMEAKHQIEIMKAHQQQVHPTLLLSGDNANDNGSESEMDDFDIYLSRLDGGSNAAANETSENASHVESKSAESTDVDVLGIHGPDCTCVDCSLQILGSAFDLGNIEDGGNENNNENNNKNNNENKSDEKDEYDETFAKLPRSMRVLLRFLDVTPHRLRSVGWNHFLQSLLSLCTDGGSNYSGNKIGLQARVMCFVVLFLCRLTRLAYVCVYVFCCFVL